MVLRELCGGRSDGFFVDVGAHHPVFYSNTYHFYCRGWRGINIEGSLKNQSLFHSLRPRDITLQAYITAATDEEVTFYEFAVPALNTCDPSTGEDLIRQGVELISKQRVRGSTIGSLLDAHMPAGERVDLLSIDIEGLDEAVLGTYPWEQYRPGIIVFEAHCTGLAEAVDLPVTRLLADHGFELVAKCGPSLIARGK